jgi:molybdenum cofactor synthesis domain-containing protein
MVAGLRVAGPRPQWQYAAISRTHRGANAMSQTADIRNVGIIVIGNEVLSAKVRDENTPFLLERLSRAGLRVGEVAIVPDDVPRMVDVIRDFARRFDLVITTGGVGPTHDDCTWQAVALALDEPLELHQELVDRIEKRSGEAMTEQQKRMALLPRGTKLEVSDGRWPMLQAKNVLVLPGVPSMVFGRIEALCARLSRPRPWLATVYFTADEWVSVPAIDAVVANFADLEIGSYPVFYPADHKLRLTFEGPDEARVQAAVAQVTAAIGEAQLVRVTWRPPTDVAPESAAE